MIITFIIYQIRAGTVAYFNLDKVREDSFVSIHFRNVNFVWSETGDRSESIAMAVCEAPAKNAPMEGLLREGRTLFRSKKGTHHLWITIKSITNFQSKNYCKVAEEVAQNRPAVREQNAAARRFECAARFCVLPSKERNIYVAIFSVLS